VSLEWIVDAGGLASLPIYMELRPREPRRVTAAEVAEGMVVTADVKNKMGALLIPSGTRITEAHLARLRSVLGKEGLVEVADAA
jgi:hypothetical protein